MPSPARIRPSRFAFLLSPFPFLLLCVSPASAEEDSPAGEVVTDEVPEAPAEGEAGEHRGEGEKETRGQGAPGTRDGRPGTGDRGLGTGDLEAKARQIRKLIGALDAAEAPARDAARKGLEAIGEEAAPFVEDALRRRGGLALAKLLWRLQAAEGAQAPFHAEAAEKRLPPPPADPAKPDKPFKSIDAYVAARFDEAVAMYRLGEYGRALALVNALLDLEPKSPLRSRLQELKLLCDHKTLQQQVLAAAVVPAQDEFRIGEEIAFLLRIRNVAPVEIRLAFGVDPSLLPPAFAAAARPAPGQAVADVFVTLRDPLGRRLTHTRSVDWPLPEEIRIPAGGTWEQRVTVASQDDDAALDDPTLMRAYDVGVRLFPARLWVGDQLERKRIVFEAGLAKAFPKDAKWRSADPLENLGKTLDDRTAFLNDLFLAAMRVPPQDADKAAALLVRALPRFRAEAADVIMVALGDLTGLTIGKDQEKWLEWGGVPSGKLQTPNSKSQPEGERGR